MDVLFLCFDILVFVSRLEVVSGGLVKGMYRRKEVVFKNKKKEGQRKGHTCSQQLQLALMPLRACDLGQFH